MDRLLQKRVLEPIDHKTVQGGGKNRKEMVGYLNDIDSRSIDLSSVYKLKVK